MKLSTPELPRPRAAAATPHRAIPPRAGAIPRLVQAHARTPGAAHSRKKMRGSHSLFLLDGVCTNLMLRFLQLCEVPAPTSRRHPSPTSTPPNTPTASLSCLHRRRSPTLRSFFQRSPALHRQNHERSSRRRLCWPPGSLERFRHPGAVRDHLWPLHACLHIPGTAACLGYVARRVPGPLRVTFCASVAVGRSACVCAFGGHQSDRTCFACMRQVDAAEEGERVGSGYDIWQQERFG